MTLKFFTRQKKTIILYPMNFNKKRTQDNQCYGPAGNSGFAQCLIWGGQKVN